MKMYVQNVVHVAAGAMVLIGLGLSHLSGSINLLTPSWLWLSAFVGANLFQYGFSGFCPLAMLLKKLGVKESSQCASSDSTNNSMIKENSKESQKEKACCGTAVH